MSCSNCGTEIDDSSIFCPKCGSRVGATSDMSPPTQSDKPPSQLGLPNRAISIGLLFILAGAILMLVALSQDLYTARCAGEDCEGLKNFNLNFDQLKDSDFHEFFELNWSGVVLPLIFMIIFASITILSTFYTLVTGNLFKQLWGWLALLSAAAIISNFLYLLVSFLTFENLWADWQDDATFYITPHLGWVLAFIGTVAIGIGSKKLKAEVK